MLEAEAEDSLPGADNDVTLNPSERSTILPSFSYGEEQSTSHKTNLWYLRGTRLIKVSHTVVPFNNNEQGHPICQAIIMVMLERWILSKMYVFMYSYSGPHNLRPLYLFNNSLLFKTAHW